MAFLGLSFSHQLYNKVLHRVKFKNQGLNFSNFSITRRPDYDMSASEATPVQGILKSVTKY